MRELVISRAKWLRGEGDSTGLLLRPLDGKMCCIGIYLSACGVPDYVLRNETVANNIDQAIPNEAKWLLGVDEYGDKHTPPDVGAAYSINDEALAEVEEEDEFDDMIEVPKLAEPEIEKELREDKIAEIFAKHDVKVIFTD